MLSERLALPFAAVCTAGSDYTARKGMVTCYTLCATTHVVVTAGVRRQLLTETYAD